MNRWVLHQKINYQNHLEDELKPCSQNSKKKDPFLLKHPSKLILKILKYNDCINQHTKKLI